MAFVCGCVCMCVHVIDARHTKAQYTAALLSRTLCVTESLPFMRLFALLWMPARNDCISYIIHKGNLLDFLYWFWAKSDFLYNIPDLLSQYNAQRGNCSLSRFQVRMRHLSKSTHSNLHVQENAAAGWCGYQVGERIGDHDAALGYVLEFWPHA